MTDDEDGWHDVSDFLDEYIAVVEQGYDLRAKKHQVDLDDRHPDKALGALLARQTSLALELAKSPGIWNAQISPLVLRAMADVHINIAWILEDVRNRGREFFMYGLGQEKLFVEHIKALLSENCNDSDYLKNQIEIREDWLNSQYAEWATEVNVGSWSGKSTREIAKSVDLDPFYKFEYAPLSAGTHSTWHFIGIHNVRKCTNPMHKFHLVPSIEPSAGSPQFLVHSAKLLSDTFARWDVKLGVSCDIELPHSYLLQSPLFRKPAGERSEENGT